MNLQERKMVETRIEKLLAVLTTGEQAVLYKTLYATGLRISDCDQIIAWAPAPEDTAADSWQPHSPLFHPHWRPKMP